MDRYHPRLSGKLDVDGNTLLCMAAQNGSLDMVKYLVEECHSGTEQHGIWKPPDSADPLTVPPIWVASRENRLQIVKYLVEKGVCVSAASNTGITPLMSACEGRSMDVVKYLVSLKGENRDIGINRQTKEGLTALHYAVRSKLSDVKEANMSPRSTHSHGGDGHKSADIERLLTQHGAHVNIQTAQGTTLLHLAIEGTLLDMIELLIKEGADINSQDGKGWAPLHLAVDQKLPDVIKYLIKENADVNAQTSLGHYSLALCNTKKFTRYNKNSLSKKVQASISRHLKVVLPCISP